MRRRFEYKDRELEDFLIRFYPAGNYTWVVPGGCTEVDVFLVGGGSGNGSGAGSGYTKTYKRNNIGIKQGSQISVTPGQEINIIVGKGGAGLYYGYPEKGGFSQFMNSSYRADGGNPSGNGLLNGENSTGGPYTGGNGGSGGSVDQSGDEFYAGSDGSDAPGITDGNGIYHPPGTKYGGGKGQGYTTRDFGEPTGKRLAFLKSKLKDNKHTSKQIRSLTNKRNNKIKDYLHKASRILVNHVVSNGINTIIIGHNKCWKQEINIGKRNNQNFVSIPFNVFISMISYKATLEGINVKIVEESYTSKCSFLDNERICKHESYKGRRTKRGLFKTSFGRTINADINGAFNIIRKSEKESFDVTMLPEGRGFWWNPVRISV